MGKYINLRFISFIVMFMFLFNIFSLSLNYEKRNVLIKTTFTEQFFSALNLPSDIVSKILQEKQNPYDTNRKNNTDKDKTFVVNDYMLPVVISTVFTGLFFGSCLYKVFISNDLLNKVIEYPLKIPFWLSIFLLLLIKILFNVLPRSISINYNKKYIERACIV